jgi:hypothetical protein
MLYDKRWDRPEIKVDPFSLESLIAWLETMPPRAKYCYLSNGECLLAKYFTALGYENVRMWTNSFWCGIQQCPRYIGQEEARRLGLATPIPAIFNRVAQDEPATFGSALRRARKALAERG